ncbi:MAG: hypothetical protein GC138_02960 [Gammaproteobacteria bacterium]|nr:hypothetical protein [Gammaproteobacteria bacterium]
MLRTSRALVLIVPLAFLLSACSGSGGDAASNALINTVTGVVRAAPADATQFAANDASPAGFDRVLTRLAQAVGLIAPPAQAAVTGMTPVTSATVELVQLDSAGNVVLPAIATTTTDSVTGAYTFSNSPSPSSTLAVRVVGQTSTMRAIVTGGTVDITPVSEEVVQQIQSSLIGGNVLGNYTVGEVAVLNALLNGMQVDLTGQTFDQAITLLANASAAVLPDLAAAMAAPGVARSTNTLASRGFELVGFSVFLADPSTFNPNPGGVGIRRSDGTAYFDSNGLVTGSSGARFFTSTLHDLTSVHTQTQGTGYLNGLSHVVAPTGQLVVETQSGNAVAGLVSPDAQFMAYPIDEETTGFLRQGLRIGIRNAVGSSTQSKTSQATNALLDDPLIAGSSLYNMVSIDARVAGPVSSGSVDSHSVTIRHGVMSFNDGSETTLPNSGSSDLYGSLDVGTTNAIYSSNLTQPLVSPYTAGATTFSTTADTGATGFYRVFTSGTVLFLSSSGGFLGSGAVSPDGNLLAYYSASDTFPETTLDVLANDHATTATPLVITAVGTPTGGTVTIDPSAKSLHYTPTLTAPVATTDSFTYTVSDGTTATVGTVTLDLVASGTAANGTPAGDDSYTVDPSSTGDRLNVLDNDGQGFCVASVGATTGGGTATIVSDLTAVLYTPGISTTSDTFTYTVGTKTIDTTTTPGSGQFACSPVSPAVSNTVTVTVAATTPAAANDHFRVDIENRAARGLTFAAKQSSTTPTLGGTYTVVEFSQDTTPGTTPGTGTATLASAYRNGKLALDGLGGVTSGRVASKRASMDLAAAVAGTAMSTTLTPVVAPDDLSTSTTSSYTVSTTGVVTMVLTLTNNESISGQGFASSDGNIIALATEISDATGRLGRGFMILSRQTP